MSIIITASPQVNIEFSNWEKYVVPVIKDARQNTIILYSVEDNVLKFRTFINGFLMESKLTFEELIKLYDGREIEVGITQPPDRSPSDLINKFNQDYLDGRGIPEKE